MLLLIFVFKMDYNLIWEKEGLTSIMTTERNLCAERWFTNTLTMPYSYSVSSYSKKRNINLWSGVYRWNLELDLKRPFYLY